MRPRRTALHWRSPAITALMLVSLSCGGETSSVEELAKELLDFSSFCEKAISCAPQTDCRDVAAPEPSVFDALEKRLKRYPEHDLMECKGALAEYRMCYMDLPCTDVGSEWIPAWIYELIGGGGAEGCGYTSIPVVGDVGARTIVPACAIFFEEASSAYEDVGP